MFRDIILWLAGVPIFVIILLHLFGAFHWRHEESSVRKARPMAEAEGERASPLDLLHRASQLADKLFMSRIADHGLTPRQFLVLKAVANANIPSQTDIMEATGIDRSSASELVGRLGSLGLLVRRRIKSDARRYAVTLTGKVRDARARGERAARAADEELLGLLPTGDRATFLKALQLIAASWPRSVTRGGPRADGACVAAPAAAKDAVKK